MKYYLESNVYLIFRNKLILMVDKYAYSKYCENVIIFDLIYTKLNEFSFPSEYIYSLYQNDICLIITSVLTNKNNMLTSKLY